MENKGFFQIGTIILIALAGLFLYWSFLERTPKCNPPYMKSCRCDLDCLLNTHCKWGQGIICYPECYFEGFKIDCQKGKCIWTKQGKGPLK